MAALLPAWVPLAAVNDAARPAAPRAETTEATPVPPGTEGTAGAATVPEGEAGAIPAEPADSADPTPPVRRLPAAAEERVHGRHVVLDAPLWSRLVQLDPEVPAELLRAGIMVHLVAESRVRPFARVPCRRYLARKCRQPCSRSRGATRVLRPYRV